MSAVGEGDTARGVGDTQARLRAALTMARDRLNQAGVASPAAEARTIVEDASGAAGSLFVVRTLPPTFEARVEEILHRREQREPLQLILGWAPFRRLRLHTAAGVFIPRPETELIIDVLRAQAPRAQRILDLCTGTGAIAAAVLDEVPQAQVIAVERETPAVHVATKNLTHTADPDRWALLRGDVRENAWAYEAGSRDLARSLEQAPDGDQARRWEQNLSAQDAEARAPGQFDAVLSNPPYIPAGAIPQDPEVREHDPAAALYGGGEDGLEVPRAVVERAAEVLADGGVLVMEHADVQGAALRDLACAYGGFTDVHTVRDLTGKDRFLVARRLRTASQGEAGA